MIVFRLQCSNAHQFDGWFKDGSTYEAQVAGGEIACPSCGDTQVTKAIMAPAISPSRNKASLVDPEAVQTREMLRHIRQEVEANFDYVGERFADEARKIHYGEVERRQIYGEATQEQERELAEEGLEISRVPWVRLED